LASLPDKAELLWNAESAITREQTIQRLVVSEGEIRALGDSDVDILVEFVAGEKT
jgi:hypothetical protein